MGEVPENVTWTDYLGRRISIRYRLSEPGEFSEVIGIVQAVREPAEGGATVEVIKRSGDVVVVPTDRITHLKDF